MPLTGQLESKKGHTMRYITERDAYEEFNEWLDQTWPAYELLGATYRPSEVLQQVDPIAYRCGFVDWLDSEELTTDESEADDDKCTKCAMSLLDNEGYDNLCGNCADRDDG